MNSTPVLEGAHASLGNAEGTDEPEHSIPAVDSPEPERTPTSSDQRTRRALTVTGVSVAVGTAVGVGGFLLAPLVAPLALAAVGFSAGGVAAGSMAAGMQAAIGNVAAGSFFALCQSAGVLGIGAATAAATGAAVGTTAAATTAAVLATRNSDTGPRSGNTSQHAESQTEDSRGSGSANNPPLSEPPLTQTKHEAQGEQEDEANERASDVPFSASRL